jgi:hypothetical protein
VAENQQRTIVIAIVAVVGAVVLLAAGVVIGLLVGRGQPATTVTPSLAPASTSAPTPSATMPEPAPPTPSTSASAFDPNDYNTAAVRLDCQAKGMSFLAAQAVSGDLLVHLGLTAKVKDGEEVEILLSTQGDDTYDQVVTWSADTNSSHLWDGEDEYNFVVVRGGITGGDYEVDVPLDELQPSAPVRILANLIHDPGDDGFVTCSEEALVVR